MYRPHSVELGDMPGSKTKQRADLLLVQLGLVESRQRAQALILAGKVSVGDRRVDKAGERLPVDAPIQLRGNDHPFVSRGGVKLEGALVAFDYDPEGLVAADFGASTGGFSDCLLQRNVRKIYAIDVGYGQLHPKLRSDPKVVVMERTNARYLGSGDFTEPIDLVVIDASFIGLDKLFVPAYEILCPGGDVLALIKPQFEVNRQSVGKGGVVRNALVRQNAIDRIERMAIGLGLKVMGHQDAIIKGPRGNQEHFIWLRKE